MVKPSVIVVDAQERLKLAHEHTQKYPLTSRELEAAIVELNEASRLLHFAWRTALFEETRGASSVNQEEAAR
jgi:hypothetical protein